MVLAQIIAERMDAIHNLVPENRIYLLDEVNANALYLLAQQFDVLGYKGWFFADTEEKRRELIRRAIELHRYKGTPWSVKEAIKQLGFTNVNIIERYGLITALYNGEYTYNGGINYASGDGEWATFVVEIDINEWPNEFTAFFTEALKELITEYKGVRNHLVHITLRVTFEDSMEMFDVSDYGNYIEDTDELTGMRLLYNGEAFYDGEYDYDETADTLRIDVQGPPPPPSFNVIWGAPPSGIEQNNVRFDVSGVNVQVNWNDGSPVETLTSGTQAFTHTYSGGGNKVATVTYEGIDEFKLGHPSLTHRLATFLDFSQNAPEMVNLEIRGADMNTLDLSNFTTLWSVSAAPNGSNEPALIDQIVMPTVPNPISTFNVRNTGLSAANINTILMALDAGGESGGTVDVRQTPPAPPFGDGINAIIELLGKGWTVQYDI